MTDAPSLYPHNRGLFQYALAFAGLGDKEKTVETLEGMANLGPVRLGRDLTYPEFGLVRGDPRVKALRKKVGLPQLQFARADARQSFTPLALVFKAIAGVPLGCRSPARIFWTLIEITLAGLPRLLVNAKLCR